MSVQVAVPNPDSQAAQRTVVVEHDQARYFEQENGCLLVRRDNGVTGLLAIYAPYAWVTALLS